MALPFLLLGVLRAPGDLTSPKPPKHPQRPQGRLDPVDGLAAQAGLFGDLSDTDYPLAQHGADLEELLACEARLAAEVGTRVILLSVLDASPLCGLGGLSLCLRGRGHETDQRITDCPSYGVLGGTVKGEVVDHRADDDAAPHELSDGVAYILVIPAKAIDPTDYKHVTGPELVERRRPSGRSTRRVEAGHAVVGHDFIDGEARDFGLSKLWSMVCSAMDSRSFLNDVHGDHDHRACPSVLLPVPIAKADGNRLPGTVLVGLGAFGVLRDGALLNVEQTRSVAVVVECKLSTRLDCDATHAELTPGHPLNLIGEVECGQHLRLEALAVRGRCALSLPEGDPRQNADEPGGALRA
jgi:hypothetical protein